MASKRVRVLVVDDSSLVRGILRAGLSTHPQIEVVGMAADGREALRQISKLRPDVVTLDVEMPNMNGIAVLERVAGKVPVSFVMVSTLTQAGARITFEALRKGAFDFITKPDAGGIAGIPEFRREVQQKVLAAAKAKGVKRHIITGAGGGAPTLPPNRVRGWVVGIGCSAGGTQTLPKILPAFPSDFVPVVITQHMPPKFTTSFANMLNNECAMEVREAADGDRLRQGTAYVAPGDYHLTLVRSGVELRVKLDRGDKVSGHRPSVDVMFSSLARVCRNRCVGAVLTGMGHDGADGVRLLKKAGARTVAQDEETSLVYGMPMEAAKTGCIDAVAPMTDIPRKIAELLKENPIGARR